MNAASIQRPAILAPRNQTSPQPGPGAGDPPYDLTELDNGREVYFLPGIDRFAATVAACADGPVTVRSELAGQFIEYTLDPGNPGGPVQGNLNGNPFELTIAPGASGELELTAHTSGGEVSATLAQAVDREDLSALVGPNAMPVTQHLTLHSDAAEGQPVIDVLGNFACARMYETYTPVSEGLRLEGEMGKHTITGLVHEGQNGTLVLEGQFGDLPFRQTFTPAER